MKKTLFFLTFLILSLLGYSQDYIPLVDTNSVWNITWNCYKPPPYPCYSDYYKYRISGDTMYNDTIYKKLFRIDMDQECSSIIEDSVFIGGMREDTSEKKIYFIQDTFFGEYLLFDFGLEVGDTVPYSFNNYGYPELYVSLIDSVICSDGYRKRFVYSRDTWADIVVIEGIGACTGLIEPMEIFEYVSTMRCFYNKGSMIYMEPYVSSCNLEMDTCISTTIKEQLFQTETIQFYPNPVYDQAIVSITDARGDFHNYSLWIFDVHGKTKFFDNFLSDKMIIDHSDFTAGIYFYMVNFKMQKISSGTFIIK